MNKAKKIEAIYSKIANKELSFGCIVNGIDNMIYDFYYVGFTGFGNSGKMIFQRKGGLTNGDKSYKQILSETFNRKKVKIVGHPVLIGDVLDYKEKNGEWSFLSFGYAHILDIWKNKRLPIEEQSELCIDYIYNLIEKGIN